MNRDVWGALRVACRLAGLALLDVLVLTIGCWAVLRLAFDLVAWLTAW